MANSHTAIVFVVALALIAISIEAQNDTSLPRFSFGLGSLDLLSPLAPKNVDICRTVTSQGYKCEFHNVTTEDGYIPGVQRITASRAGQNATKPPVLLQHGIFADGLIFTSDSPSQSLAFILADRGYDIWLANTRGTAPSRGHISLKDNDQRYWEWTWDQLAAYELPAMFTYINTQTGQKIHYIAHSLGTLTALGALSEGKLVNMTRSATLMCPIFYITNMPSVLVQALADSHLVDDFYGLNVREFVLQGEMISTFVNLICNRPGIDCKSLLTTLTGPNCCLTKHNSDIYNEPTSVKLILHFARTIRSGEVDVIRKFDYGNPNVNMLHYNQSSPPIYNISAVPTDLPLYISYGKKDVLSDPNNVHILLNKLKNHQKDKLTVQCVKKYAHLDFVRGTNANTVVYEPMISFMEKYD